MSGPGWPEPDCGCLLEARAAVLGACVNGVAAPVQADDTVPAWPAFPGPGWGRGSRRTPGDAAAPTRIPSASLFPRPVPCFQGVWAHLDRPHASLSLFISWEDMRTKSLLPGQLRHAGEDAPPGNSCSKSSFSSLKSYCASGWMAAPKPTQPRTSQQPQQRPASGPFQLELLPLRTAPPLGQPGFTLAQPGKRASSQICLIRWGRMRSLLYWVLAVWPLSLNWSLSLLTCERGIEVLSHCLLKERLLCAGCWSQRLECSTK